MLFGVGRVGLQCIAPRGHSIAEPEAPAPLLDLDFMTSLPSGWAVARTPTTAASDHVYTDPATTTTYNVFPVNTPRFLPQGLLLERGCTNLFLNSEAPVNQTITVAVGLNNMWMIGTGSVTVTPGTAVADSYGTATNGHPVVMNVTTPGTVNVVVSGSVTRVQFAAGEMPTSYVRSNATAVLRNGEILSLSPANGVINTADGTYFVEFQFAGMPGPNGHFIGAGAGAAGNNNDRDHFRANNATDYVGYTVDAGGTSYVSCNVTGSGTPQVTHRVAMARSAVRSVASCDGAIGPAAVGTVYRPSAMDTISVFSGGGGGGIAPTGYLRKFKYWPYSLTDYQMAKITE